jgi:3-oxoacyl-[acyl-carrier protein] reductase
MDLGLSGMTAVVAGGSRGCGRGISEVLAAEGAAVVFSGRIHEPVTATEAAIQVNGGKAVGVVADMTTREGALRIVRTAQEHFGDPDILVVNSPGAVPDRVTGRWRGFENSSDANFEEIYGNYVMSLVYAVMKTL